MRSHVTNQDIADTLDRVGDLLRGQGAPSYRVRTYWNAARALRALPEDAAQLVLQNGRKGAERIPGIGRAFASMIEELARTGRLGLHERLMLQAPPEHLLATVPGIGPELARRIHAQLLIETLEDLEVACHDGRLAQVAGFGPRRLALVRRALETVLRRGGARRGRIARLRQPEPQTVVFPQRGSPG